MLIALTFLTLATTTIVARPPLARFRGKWAFETNLPVHINGRCFGAIGKNQYTVIMPDYPGHDHVLLKGTFNGEYLRGLLIFKDGSTIPCEGTITFDVRGYDLEMVIIPKNVCPFTIKADLSY